MIMPMYIDRAPNRNSPPAILLRETWREGNKTRKRTLANLSHWPEEKIQTLQLVLRGVKMIPQETLTIGRSLPHGHVEAVLGTIRNIGLDSVIASKLAYYVEWHMCCLAMRNFRLALGIWHSRRRRGPVRPPGIQGCIHGCAPTTEARHGHLPPPNRVPSSRLPLRVFVSGCR